jgi:FAD/FMN-containing dehydrogenase
VEGEEDDERLMRWGRRAFALVAVLGAGAGASACFVTRAPIAPRTSPTIVNDVTQLNPITVSRVITPTTTEEIVAAVTAEGSREPISIGGSRHSMGGQTATPGGLQIDMRQFNRVLAFDSIGRTITVQTGIRWREIQDRIDPANLSVKVMQSYANFTVGGSLSVNAHGRYVGQGSIVGTVRSIRIVLADGSVREASRVTNSDIFYGAIGGYGGLGVITEATLDLVENVRVKLVHRTMPVTEYRDYFFAHVRDSDAVVFHNADIYPDDYTTVNAVSYVRTDERLTVRDRLVPKAGSYILNQFAMWVVSEWPFGKAIRQRIVDPWPFREKVVEWRNHEASADAAELEPASRARSTYVLQEYFVPVDRFDDFVPAMRDVFRRHRVNVINVSVRHARPDSGTLLAWAPREVFAFVVYYKQGTDTASQTAVGVWTRQLVDAALALGGSYYLPYQLHATEEQFLRAYPRAPELFALKKRIDPANKFRNMLWDKYYRP